MRDAPERTTTIQSVLYALAAAVLIILSSMGMFYAFNLPSEVEFTESSMTCRFYFKEPVFSDVMVDGQIFTQVTLDDCVSDAAVGSPVLPVYPATLLLPQGGTIDTIHVDYPHYLLIEYDMTGRPVLPQQECVPFSDDMSTPAFVINESAYEAEPLLFDRLYELGDTGFCRGFSLLTVYLHPVQYLPTQAVLYYLPEMTITVEFRQSNDAPLTENTSLLRYSLSDRERIESMVANPSLIESYEPYESSNVPLISNGLCDPVDNNGLGYDYIIITSASLSATTGYTYNWSDLIEHRRSYSNLEAAVVTTEGIDACAGYWNGTALFNDSAAHIRAFCQDAYMNWGTEYVVLGGDWDSTPSHQIVPYRLFTDTDEMNTYDTMACDMYYSHLDGNWWDESDGVWGGGQFSNANDYYGELCVGRLAVHDASQVSNAVQKIIWYDLNSSGGWLRNASFWGGNLGWTVTSEQYMEELRLGTDTYRSFTGFEEWNIAHQNDTIDTSGQLYHADLGGSYEDFFIESIEDDDAAIINHIDHGSSSVFFSLNTWLSLSNTKPFFGYSQGCLSGRFHSGDAGCEQLICTQPGSFSYGLVLNTGYGYGSSLTTNGPNQYLETYFWDYFFSNQSTNQSQWYLGKAFGYSQDMMAEVIDAVATHAWCYNWYSTHFFGDPAQLLRVHLENEPVDITNEHPSDDSYNVACNTSFVSVVLEDPEGDLFNWSIWTSPDVGSNSSSDASNGTMVCPLFGLAYEMNYTWFVNVSDGTSWANETFCFSTQVDPQNNSPVFSIYLPQNGSIGVSLNLSSLSLVIDDPEGDVFNWTIQTSPDVGSAMGIHEGNGTKSCNLSGLLVGTMYTWFVNATDSGSGNTSFASYMFTTTSPPIMSNLSVSNGSTDVAIGASSLSVYLIDPEGDLFNWSISTSPDVGSDSGVNESNGSKTCVLSGLAYSTTYQWYISCIDQGSGAWANASFWFTTASEPQGGGWSPPETPTEQVNHPPERPAQPMGLILAEPGTAYSYTSAAFDADEDTVRFQFKWDNDSLADWTAYVASNSSVSVNHTWDTVALHSVMVVAQDENGLLSEWSEPLIVTVIESLVPIEPTVIINATKNASVNQTILFETSGSLPADTIIVSYLWDFGDGTLGAGENPSHVYAQPGRYQVTVTLIDAEGNQYTKTMTVTVFFGSKEAAIAESPMQIPYLLIIFVVLLVGVLLSVYSCYNRKQTKEKSKNLATITRVAETVEQQVDELISTQTLTHPVSDVTSDGSSTHVSVEGRVDEVLVSKHKDK